jgi:zinc D-Ala-D-Ala dipeptidase
VNSAAIRPLAGALGLAALFAAAAGRGAETTLPIGFVRLRSVDATIAQDMRYATPHNFTQAPVPGYLAPECIVLREVADALKRVETDLRPRGLSLKVYDCYRPVRAVKAFMAWVQKPAAPGDPRYWPRTKRSDLIKAGYIAANSIHSRGTAVDLTLVAIGGSPKTPTELTVASKPDAAADPKSAYGPCNSSAREPDDSLDMGTTFDCFDPMSNTASEEITPQQRQNRQMLNAAMAQRGFKNYAREWWHFTYPQVPLPPALDFAVTK